MNKRRLEHKITIVVILIINNMSVDHEELLIQGLLHMQVNPPERRADQIVGHLLVDTNENIMMVDDKEVVIQVHHVHKEALSDEWKKLDINKH